jgi:hypothetical protein
MYSFMLNSYSWHGLASCSKLPIPVICKGFFDGCWLSGYCDFVLGESVYINAERE